MYKPIKQAVILAAGKGTRLGKLTQKCPKPLIIVGDEPIICRSLTILRDLGFQKIVINTHYLAEKLENYLNDWVNKNIDGIRVGNASTSAEKSNITAMEIVFSREKELLEIGGGLRKALEYLDKSPFLVINGDIVWQENQYPLIKNLLNNFDGNNMDSLMAIAPVSNSLSFRNPLGDLDINADNRVNFSATNKPYNYIGIQVISPRLVENLPLGEANILRDSWENSARTQRVSGYIYNFSWVDMGSAEGLKLAQKLVRQCANVPMY